jgi:hypothetical protein
MKKIMTLVIGVSLLFPSGALFAKERHGAEIEITVNLGPNIEGELIAVTQDLILVLEDGLKKSIKISDINVITVVKRGSKVGKGAISGVLVGGIGGGLIGFASGLPSGNTSLKFHFEGVGAAIGVAIGALIGAGTGALIGSVYRFKANAEFFQINGKSDSEIKEILTKLRSKARFPDYQ